MKNYWFKQRKNVVKKGLWMNVGVYYLKTRIYSFSGYLAFFHVFTRILIFPFIDHSFLTDWAKECGSNIVYEPNPTNPILYVLPITSILGKLSLVAAGDTGTIPFSERALRDTDFPLAFADRTDGGGDGCRLWFVNGLAMDWSRDM